MIIVTLGSCSSPRTLLVAIACASRDWPSKLCSTRRIGCMLASLQTIKISAPLKFIVDSASTLSKPEVIQYNLHNRSSFTSTIYITSVGNAFHSAIKKLFSPLPLSSMSGDARASCRSASSSKDRRHSRKSCLRADASGRGMYIRFSNLRSMAVSRSQGQFVAPNRTTLRTLSPSEPSPAVNEEIND